MATVDLTINQGTDYVHTFIWKDENGDLIDLTSYTAKMQIRPNCGDGTLTLELSTVNGRISLGGTAGSIGLSISNSDTEALNFVQEVYDIELTDGGGTVTRLVSGKVYLSKEVTV